MKRENIERAKLLTDKVNYLEKITSGEFVRIKLDSEQGNSETSTFIYRNRINSDFGKSISEERYAMILQLAKTFHETVKTIVSGEVNEVLKELETL